MAIDSICRWERKEDVEDTSEDQDPVDGFIASMDHRK